MTGKEKFKQFEMTRRQALRAALFGVGGIGLRSLATGLPTAFLLNPKKALAQAAASTTGLTPQYLLLATTGNGDPMNCNVPGAYGFGAGTGNAVVNPPAFAVGGAPQVTLGNGQTYAAANVWNTLSTQVLARTSFFHFATQTIVHPDEIKVLRCFDNIRTDPVISMCALANQSALGCIQQQPISLGGDVLVAQGAPVPNLNPASLKVTLLSQPGTLENLQSIRDHDLDALNAMFKANGSKAEQAALDQYALSQTQVRQISATLLNTLSSINDNSTDSQMLAATVLFRMNVSAAVGIHISFGGDNHNDNNWTSEVTAHQQALATPGTTGKGATVGGSINNLFNNYLKGSGGVTDLTDSVTLATMQVFGRVLNTTYEGRAHNGQHCVGLMIGKNVKPGVIGGLVANVAGTPIASPFDSTTGQMDPNGDVPLASSLWAYGRTVGAACGLSEAAINNVIVDGTTVTGALQTS